MFVRDSCSKQLDSDRLAADVPEVFMKPLALRLCKVRLYHGQKHLNIIMFS